MPAAYSTLSPEELVEEFDSVSSALAGAILEMSQVKIQLLYVFNRGYMNSHETSVSGRERSAEVASEEIKNDEILLQGNIDSLRVLRDFLAELVRRG